MTREEFYRQELLKELRAGKLSKFTTKDKIVNASGRNIIDYGNVYFIRRGRDLMQEYGELCQKEAGYRRKHSNKELVKRYWKLKR